MEGPEGEWKLLPGFLKGKAMFFSKNRKVKVPVPRRRVFMHKRLRSDGSPIVNYAVYDDSGNIRYLSFWEEFMFVFFSLGPKR